MRLVPKSEYIYKNFDDAKTMCFLIQDEKLFEKYNEIWGKIKKYIKRKKFGSDPVLIKKYLKTKIKFHNNKYHYKSTYGRSRVHLSVINSD